MDGYILTLPSLGFGPLHRFNSRTLPELVRLLRGVGEEANPDGHDREEVFASAGERPNLSSGTFTRPSR